MGRLGKRRWCTLLTVVFMCSILTVGLGPIIPQEAYAASKFSLLVGVDSSATIQQPANVGSFVDAVMDSNGNIYASQSSSYKVWKYTKSSSTWSIISLGSTTDTGSTNPGKFGTAMAMKLSSNNILYVVDSNSRIQKYTTPGGWSVISLGNGSGVGQLNSPGGIALDSSGNLYVADTLNNRIQKYTISSGQWSVFLAGTGVQPSSPSDLSKGIYRPAAVAVNSLGDAYIGENYYSSFFKYTVSGGQLALLETEQGKPIACGGEGNFGDILIDSADNAYYTSDWSGQLKKCFKKSNHISVVMGYGYTVDTLNYPKYMNPDINGKLMICDVGTSGIFGIKGYSIPGSNGFNISIPITPGVIELVSPTLGVFSGIDLDGRTKTVTLSATGGSIKDSTGSGSGWTLKVGATQFVNKARLLSRGSFRLTTVPQPIGVDQNSDASTIIVVVPNQSVDQTTPLTLFTVGVNEGMGTFNISDHMYTLTMAPKEAYAGVYVSTITYTLTPGV